MRLLRLATLGMIAAAIVAPALARAADADPRVAQLVAASGQALGISSIASAKTMRADMNISAAGLTGTGTQWIDLHDGRFAESANLGPVVSQDGYDGRVAWNADQTHLVWNTGGDSGRASEMDQAYLASYALWRPQMSGAAVSWLGTKTASGTSYDVLSITPRDSLVPFELWFDRTTHLPAHAFFVNGFTTATSIFSDYRKVGGLNVPYATHTDPRSEANRGIQLHLEQQVEIPNRPFHRWPFRRRRRHYGHSSPSDTGFGLEGQFGNRQSQVENGFAQTQRARLACPFGRSPRRGLASQPRRNAGQDAGPQLPHHVSVRLSGLDDPRLGQQARHIVAVSSQHQTRAGYFHRVPEAARRVRCLTPRGDRNRLSQLAPDLGFELADPVLQAAHFRTSLGARRCAARWSACPTGEAENKATPLARNWAEVREAGRSKRRMVPGSSAPNEPAPTRTGGR